MQAWLSALVWVFVVLMADVSAVSAQQPGRVYKIGWLWIGREGYVQQPIEKWAGDGAVFCQVLESNGFVPGKNLVVEVRHANGDPARLDAEAGALVASGVDVIVTSGTPPTVAAMKATTRIPIVFQGVGDPVEKGIVSSLARPTGNVTGMAVMVAFPKQWQMLHEVAPNVRRAGFMGNAGNRPAGDQQDAFEKFMVDRMKANAAAAGIEPIRMRVRTLDDVEAYMAELASLGNAGVIVVNDALLESPEWRNAMMEKALKHRLPTSCAQTASWAAAGCLVTYREDWAAIMSGAAVRVAKILKGMAPTALPVEQPTDYKLLVNAKTAKALGLALPPAILALAHEVIE